MVCILTEPCLKNTLNGLIQTEDLAPQIEVGNCPIFLSRCNDVDIRLANKLC